MTMLPRVEAPGVIILFRRDEETKSYHDQEAVSIISFPASPLVRGFGTPPPPFLFLPGIQSALLGSIECTRRRKYTNSAFSHFRITYTGTAQ